jgi:hypothetical protein
VLVRVKNWERYGLKSWIEAAQKLLHHNVFANKLARIAWTVVARGGTLELRRSSELSPNPLDARAVLGAVKAERAALRARLDRTCARRSRQWAGRDEGTAPCTNKGTGR